jgi:hypothetical protein
MVYGEKPDFDQALGAVKELAGLFVEDMPP